jgi:hypothetical protein
MFFCTSGRIRGKFAWLVQYIWQHWRGHQQIWRKDKKASLCNSVQVHEGCWQSRPVFIILYHPKNIKWSKKIVLWLSVVHYSIHFECTSLQIPWSRLKYK